MSQATGNNPDAEPEESCYLHLKEINVAFKSLRPNSKFRVKLEVGTDKTYQSPVFGKHKNIEWKFDRYILPSATAKLTVRKSRIPKLKFMKKYASFDVDFGAQDIGGNKTVQLEDDHGRFTVNLVFAVSRPTKDVARLLSHIATTALASKVALLEKVDKILDFAEIIVGFGSVVAELNPVATVVVATVKVALKKCQKISKCHDEAVALMTDMVYLLPLPDLVKDKVKEPETKKVFEDFLNLVKEAADALTEYASPSRSSFYARTWFQVRTRQGSFIELNQRLTNLKQNMNLYLGASTYGAVHNTQGTVHAVQQVTSDIQQTADSTSHYKPDHSCLKGTEDGYIAGDC
ncbi:hypothetical protein DFH11DRAFT_1549354 [Phellopilus nigrolimitatus]|nr:hypothetical protein DFH11DRAFT_1549354 [Phellopilus nigrolimitatus]